MRVRFALQEELRRISNFKRVEIKNNPQEIEITVYFDWGYLVQKFSPALILNISIDTLDFIVKDFDTMNKFMSKNRS